MRPVRISYLALMASLVLAPLSWAQAPAIPGAPAGVAAPTTAPPNLLSKILPNAEQKAACKNCFCNSAIGKLISGGGGPMALMSGGLIPNRCAQNSLANDLKKSAESPAGAAAKVKADEAEAKERAAAVRFLANVDCERWPEATETLKNALRKDRNECVRLEAALALRNGCCCNNETIDALKNCVLGEAKTDPNPVERSERVRSVAAEALSRCVMSQPVEDPREKVQKTEAPPTVDPADYYRKIAQTPRDQVVAGARAVLVSMQKPVQAQAASQEAGGPASATAAPVTAVAMTAPMGQHANSISGIVANAFSPGGAEGREPFFSGLTRTLTGKQEYSIPARQEPVPAVPTATIHIPEPATVIPNHVPRIPEPATVIPNHVPPAAPRSVPIPRLPPEIKVILPPVSALPAVGDPFPDGPRENKGPMQVIHFRPTSEFRLGAPVDAKAAPSIELMQPAPVSESSSAGPRESRGIVTIGEVPAAPRR